MLFSAICLIDQVLLGATTPGQNGPWSDGKKKSLETYWMFQVLSIDWISHLLLFCFIDLLNHLMPNPSYTYIKYMIFKLLWR